MPLASVIMPTYNRAEIVSESIRSVLNQTITDLELIVVDDGSTDDTGAVLNTINDPRLVVINQDNQGPGPARNTGIGAARGKYLLFLDSDDLWLRDKLEKQLKSAASDDKFAWGYTDAFAFESKTGDTLFYFSERNHHYEGMVAPKLIFTNFIINSSVIVRRSILDETGVFPCFSKAEDWDLWLRIAVSYPVTREATPLLAYRIHKARLTESMRLLEIHKSHLEVIERAVEYAPEVYGPLRKSALAAQYRRTGETLARQGQLAEARQMFLAAMKLSPTTLSTYPRLALTFTGKQVSSLIISTYRRKLGFLD